MRHLRIAVLAVDLTGISPGDWGQILGAAFTALAAGAACFSVIRVEKDRWKRTVPDLHVELIVDIPNQQVRLLITNHGGPAREVRVAGVLGDFGFVGIAPPSSFWQPGEIRTVLVSMPPVRAELTHVLVEGRDLGMRHLVVATSGGATYRWPLRKAKKLSLEKEWQRLFPGVPGPLDVKHTPMTMELVDRKY